MPQYGVVVYSPAPADPMALTAEYLESLDNYPARAKELRGKVLGGTYFAQQRGFALGPSTGGMAIQGDAVREGTLLGTNLVVSAFYVLAAPSMDVAVQVARLHPAARNGGVEVRPLFVPADQVHSPRILKAAQSETGLV